MAQSNNPNAWLWPLVADDFWCGEGEGADDATGLSYASIVNSVPGPGAGSGYAATSDTPSSFSTGVKGFTTQTGLAYTAGARVRFTSRASGSWQEGTIVSYSGGTMSVNIDWLSTSVGAAADWNLNITGARGVLGVGAFIAAASATKTVADTNVTSICRIVFYPGDAPTAVVMGSSKNIFFHNVVAGVSFDATTGDGSALAGTENFGYLIF